MTENNKKGYFMKRRQFVAAAAAAVTAPLWTPTAVAQSRRTLQGNRREADREDAGAPLHVAVNQYTATNIYQRDGVNFLDRLEELKTCGVDGLEPTAGTAEELASITRRLRDCGLESRSIYVSGALHDEAACESEITRLIAVADAAREAGTTIIVFNPAAKSGKSDAELITQSEQMQRLGLQFRQRGLTLAFHYHTAELEFGGREFHHILCGTSRDAVQLCLEQHWSYRGCGNSQVALFDHLALYRDRIVEVHLRQSQNNIWSETYGEGDLDSPRLFTELKKLRRFPHVVLEQAAENGTPKTLSAAEVFQQSMANIRKWRA